MHNERVGQLKIHVIIQFNGRQSKARWLSLLGGSSNLPRSNLQDSTNVFFIFFLYLRLQILSILLVIYFYILSLVTLFKKKTDRIELRWKVAECVKLTGGCPSGRSENTAMNALRNFISRDSTTLSCEAKQRFFFLFFLESSRCYPNF